MRHTLFLGLAMLFPATQGAAEVSHDIRFGPFVGGGTASAGLSIRHATGVSMAGSQLWAISDTIQIGPHLEFTNSYISVKGSNSVSSPEQGSELGVYDNRSFGAGLAVTYRPVSASAATVFSAVAAGRSFAKLAFDETGDNSFTQSYFQDIEGPYYSGELGAQFPLQENLGVNLAFLSHAHRLDQTKSSGTFAGDVTKDGDRLNLSGSYTDEALDKVVVLRNYGLRIGVSIQL